MADLERRDVQELRVERFKKKGRVMTFLSTNAVSIALSDANSWSALSHLNVLFLLLPGDVGIEINRRGLQLEQAAYNNQRLYLSEQGHIYAAAVDQGSAKSPRSKTPSEAVGDKTSESICFGACGIY
ncbi:hypothetical protein C5167_021766 [Papaver somniferum]|uniref:Uncharacterized protein n=1 Tax=Papaver somniferum TaxID=3469 RepID=A0A4Y7JGX1_PAPSO|nr:hypothetical protein C5167_021766 [Papaver somniferum]